MHLHLAEADLDRDRVIRMCPPEFVFGFLTTAWDSQAVGLSLMSGGISAGTTGVPLRRMCEGPSHSQPLRALLPSTTL